jgi:hypothetical protein
MRCDEFHGRGKLQSDLKPGARSLDVLLTHYCNLHPDISSHKPFLPRPLFNRVPVRDEGP